MLWKAGLDADGLESMTWFNLSEQVIGEEGAGVFVVSGAIVDMETLRSEISIARMIGDEILERSLRYGAAIETGYYYSYGDEAGNWLHEVASSLIPGIVGKSSQAQLDSPPPAVSEDEIRVIADLVFAYLRRRRESDECARVITFLLALPRVFPIDHLALAALVLGQPELLKMVPELEDPGLYGNYAVFLKGFLSNVNSESHSEEAIKIGQEFLLKWIT